MKSLLKKNHLKFTLLVMFSMFILNDGFTQVETVKDSLDKPIDMSFIDNTAFAILHGFYPNTGKIISFDSREDNNTYEILLDSLPYPRSVAIKDSILYIGFPTTIETLDLRIKPYKLDTLVRRNYFFPRSLEFVDDELFIAEEYGLSKIDLNSDEIVKEMIVPTFIDSPLSIDHQNMEMFIASGKSVFSYNIINGVKTEIISDLDYKIYSLLVKHNYLYLVNGPLNFEQVEILVYDLKDLEAEPKIFCNDLISAIGLVEHRGQLYLGSVKPGIDGKLVGEINRINKRMLFSTTTKTTAVENEKLELYPNPAQEEINIKGDLTLIETIDIFNVNGIKVKSDSKGNKVLIGDLPRGFYFLCISDKYGRLIFKEKIIKL